MMQLKRPVSAAGLSCRGHQASCVHKGSPWRRAAGSKNLRCKHVVLPQAVASPAQGASNTSSSSSSSAAASSGVAAGPTFDFVCPICLTTEFKLQHVESGIRGDLKCPRCAREFARNFNYADLTVSSGVRREVYEQKEWGGTEIFRSPLVSFAYERGWRQGFSWAGFPGADTEFDMAMDYLLPAYGNTLVDMSCGSGLFSRRFAASGKFSGVVAADFSESMLRQAREYFTQDSSLDTKQYILVRADVGRLPFATGSIAGLHAGAALHCWPNPAAAFAEISRVLAPGGVFVASTFLNAAAPLGQVVGDSLVRPLAQLAPKPSAYRWWEEQELKDLCSEVGLQDFQRHRSRQFIMFAARKPGGGANPL